MIDCILHGNNIETLKTIPDGFVDTLEYAKTKGVTRTTVCKWIKQGKLKAERHGRKWYIMPVC